MSKLYTYVSYKLSRGGRYILETKGLIGTVLFWSVLCRHSQWNCL